jgi:hypothetical protein
MVHGRRRAEVETKLASLARRHRLAQHPGRVLFSLRRFKQQAAHCGGDRPESGDDGLA